MECRICKQARDNGLNESLCPDHIKLRNTKCCTNTFHAQCLVTQFLDTFRSCCSTHGESYVPKFTCPACNQRVYIEDYVIDEEPMSEREKQLFKACLAANMHVLSSLKEELYHQKYLLTSVEKQKDDLLAYIKINEMKNTAVDISQLKDIEFDSRQKKRKRK